MGGADYGYEEAEPEAEEMYAWSVGALWYSSGVLKHKATNGQYYFVLKGGNSQILVTSETYIRKQSAVDGIDAVKRVAPGATVVDMAGA